MTLKVAAIGEAAGAAAATGEGRGEEGYGASGGSRGERFFFFVPRSPPFFIPSSLPPSLSPSHALCVCRMAGQPLSLQVGGAGTM